MHYTYPTRLPPFGLWSCTIQYYWRLTFETRIEAPVQDYKARDKRPSKRASLGRFLPQVPWSELLSAGQTCEQKLQTLTYIINYGLNTIMPERSIRVHETDRPWISVQLKPFPSKGFPIDE